MGKIVKKIKVRVQLKMRTMMRNREESKMTSSLMMARTQLKRCLWAYQSQIWLKIRHKKMALGSESNYLQQILIKTLRIDSKYNAEGNSWNQTAFKRNIS